MRTLVKYSSLAVLLLTVALVASACGGGGGTSNTPDGAVKAWFDAAFAGNVDTVKANTCSASQATVETSSEQFAAIAGAGATVDTSGLTYTKATESGDNATVSIGGNIKVTVAGVDSEQPMTGMTVPLVKESGAWKVCGM
jgi:hypothetical protein